jgi:hypothetical protein
LGEVIGERGLFCALYTDRGSHYFYTPKVRRRHRPPYGDRRRRHINVGNPAEFSIRELAEIVIDVTGSRSKIVSRPLPADDPSQRQPDITKARSVLGWGPRPPLKEGLARTIAYFEALLQGDGVRAVVGGEK